MNKFLKFILLVIVGFGLYFGGRYAYTTLKENKRISEAKKGWYVEIITSEIKIRDHATRNSNELGVVYEGEIFKVLEYSEDETEENYYWYRIRLRNGGSGWIAQNKSLTFLKDYNDPEHHDYAYPHLSFNENVYYVVSIDDINYKHLTVTDDRDDFTVSHEVFHEVDELKGINQYWIQYTVTDASGKSYSKVQKIVFEVTPPESKVKPFIELER